MPIIEANKDNFHDEVLNSEQPVLVDFYADWCGPCKMVRPILEAVVAKSQDIKFVSVNVDDEEELMEQYEVSTIPCLVLFKNGEEVKRKSGLLSQKEIERMISK